MILEDRGVDRSVFVKLQDDAVADVIKASDSIDETVQLLKTHLALERLSPCMSE